MRSSLILESNHEALRRLRPWLTAALGSKDDEVIGRIELAVHEVAANIVDHSRSVDGRLTVNLVRLGGTLQVELRDDGDPVRLPSVTELEPHPRVGGYGLLIVQQLATRVRYRRCGSENVWRIEFEIGTEQPGT